MHDTKPTKVNLMRQYTNNILLSTVMGLNRKKSPTFLIPTKFINEESALVGQLLNNLCNSFTEKKIERKTFFCSSRYEALQGVVKIFRHRSKRSSKNLISIYDPTEELRHFLAPEYQNIKVLQPGLCFLKTLKKNQIDFGKIQGIICYITKDSDLEVVNDVCVEARKYGVLIAIGFNQDFDFAKCCNIRIDTMPDCYFFGESLTDHQVPFGAFSMTNSCYRPWDNINDCLIHSSTYGGNALALGYILKKFASSPFLSSKQRPLSRKDTIAFFKRYINPCAGIIYNSLYLSPPIKSAHGFLLEIKWSKHETTFSFDCLGNSGCSIRGHTPSDIIKGVIHQHNHEYDYFKDLEEKLFQLTGLPHLFPASSGSTAVEMAVQLALMSMDHRQILTFSQNYAGKTLGALPLNGYAGYKEPFEPLYKEVIFFDPFQPSSRRNLEKLFAESRIGLVWFEILQGDTLDEIPKDIIKYIQQLQKQKKILVGVDEILTGCYRTGNFLISEFFDLQPDIITLSKGLSDMTFPFACTLISKNIFFRAQKAAPDTVRLYRTEFNNSFGSHIALNTLHQAEKHHLGSNACQVGKYIKKKLSSLIHENGLISNVKGRGLLLYIAPNPKHLIIRAFGVDVFGFILSSYLIRKHQVFLFNCRITPPLSISISETEKFTDELINGIDGLSIVKLWGIALYSIAKIYTQYLVYKIKCIFRKKN